MLFPSASGAAAAVARFFSATTAWWFAFRAWFILSRSSNILRLRPLSSAPAASFISSSPAAPSSGPSVVAVAAAAAVRGASEGGGSLLVDASASVRSVSAASTVFGGTAVTNPLLYPCLANFFPSSLPNCVGRNSFKRRADPVSASSCQGKRVSLAALNSSSSRRCAAARWATLACDLEAYSSGSHSPQSSISTILLVSPSLLPRSSIRFTTFIPSITLPKTTCLLSSQGVCAVQMKN
mmetsp:Transcript_9480/g.19624  ORF Transcript_9480/g.19624 Transcript_9480/m.19624 type:complete len:238 (+) Transcript_9480:968-1681(+)